MLWGRKVCKADACRNCWSARRGHCPSRYSLPSSAESLLHVAPLLVSVVASVVFLGNCLCMSLHSHHLQLRYHRVANRLTAPRCEPRIWTRVRCCFWSPSAEHGHAHRPSTSTPCDTAQAVTKVRFSLVGGNTEHQLWAAPATYGTRSAGLPVSPGCIFRSMRCAALVLKAASLHTHTCTAGCVEQLVPQLAQFPLHPAQGSAFPQLSAPVSSARICKESLEARPTGLQNIQRFPLR